MKRWLTWSVAAAYCLTIGCAKPVNDTSLPPAPVQADGHEHGHHDHAGPHGGTIAAWGGNAYFVEFTVDHAKKESVVYILGKDEKTAAPIKADKLVLSIQVPMFQVDLQSQPMEGEVGGQSSRFVGTHESLGKVQEFAGTISGETDGTPYSGDFKEEAHGAEHKH